MQGVDRLSGRGVRDKIDLPYNAPLDPAKLALSVHRIDSLYEKNGYFLARVTVDTTRVGDEAVKLLFRIDEGRRLAVSGVQLEGNRAIKDGDVVGAMKTRPRASSSGIAANSTTTTTPAISRNASRRCTPSAASSTSASRATR